MKRDILVKIYTVIMPKFMFARSDHFDKIFETNVTIDTLFSNDILILQADTFKILQFYRKL